MYLLGSSLKNLPVLSLQDGSIVTRVDEAVINPDTLEISAFKCASLPGLPAEPVVLPRDLRQLSADGLIVNFADDISSAPDVVRLAPLFANPYRLEGSRVISDMQRRLGRVEDFTVNAETYRVQRLHVKRPIMRSLMGSSLVIDRTQILDVNRREIVVKEATINEAALAPRTVPKINP